MPTQHPPGPGAPEKRAESAALFEIHGLEVVLGGRRVLGPLDLQIAQGSFLSILGPNGSGKTTLLRVLTGALRPTKGTVTLQGRPLAQYRTTELARQVGVVPQQFQLDFGFTVREMVDMGRYAHLRREGRTPSQDADAVERALSQTGLTALADRPVTRLSGGERQRALIAQTLAQETPVLLLDEPLNNLDLNHQLEIMQLLRRLHAEGRTIAVILHDLNMAAQYCQELLLLDQGREAARGRPDAVLDPKVILEVFRVRVAVHRHGRRPYVTPLWTRARDEETERSALSLHVIAGGGAASELLEELVSRGFTPSVGIVSVFDTDFTTAQRYGLEVVSAPPFQPFPAATLEDLRAHLDRAQVLVVAPVFFGPGNLEPLRMALAARRAGRPVVVIDEPPIAQRDLADGEATRLSEELWAAGAVRLTSIPQVVPALTGLSPG